MSLETLVIVVDRERTQAAAIVELLHAAGMRAEARECGDGAALLLLRAGEPAPASAAHVVVYGRVEELATAAALATAAVERLELPDVDNLRSIWQWSSRLVDVCRGLLGSKRVRADSVPVAPVQAAPQPLEPPMHKVRAAPEIVAVAVSTGGPPALETFFRGLQGARLPPIAVVQHIPPSYVASLAARLTEKTGYTVEPAKDCAPMLAGRAYFAPGDRHLAALRAQGGGFVARFRDEPPRAGHKPSADVLFESLLACEATGVGVILTGLGADGAAGLRALRDHGFVTVGQDEASCAIYGMPKAAFEQGALDHVLPLPQIPAFVRRCSERRAR